MKHRIIKKTLIGILFSTLLFWMNATTAQSQSLPVEQNRISQISQYCPRAFIR